MCNQAVGLVGAELERHGIATVCLSLLRHVSERVRPPRTLFVPFAHGYPLGRPGDPGLQTAILRAALRMLEDEEVEAGAIRTFPPP
jgi:hypothetical protein